MTCKCQSQFQSENPCGDHVETKWGSLSPVISLSSQRIYRNKACASCNLVTDYVPLVPALFCSETHGGRVRSIDDILLDIQFRFNNSECSVMFFVPTEAKSIPKSQLQCYLDLQTTCVSQDCDAKQMDLCENGPYLPVYTDRWLKNFYCDQYQRKCFINRLHDVFAENFDHIFRTWTTSLMLLLSMETFETPETREDTDAFLKACDENLVG